MFGKHVWTFTELTHTKLEEIGSSIQYKLQVDTNNCIQGRLWSDCTVRRPWLSIERLANTLQAYLSIHTPSFTFCCLLAQHALFKDTSLREVATYTQKHICVPYIWTKDMEGYHHSSNGVYKTCPILTEFVMLFASPPHGHPSINALWMWSWSYIIFIIYYHQEYVYLCKQRRPWWDATFCGVSSEFTLFVYIYIYISLFRMHSAWSTSASNLNFWLATPLPYAYNNQINICYLS